VKYRYASGGDFGCGLVHDHFEQHQINFLLPREKSSYLQR
jgi:hypothetical protein